MDSLPYFQNVITCVVTGCLLEPQKAACSAHLVRMVRRRRRLITSFQSEWDTSRPGENMGKGPKSSQTYSHTTRRMHGRIIKQNTLNSLILHIDLDWHANSYSYSYSLWLSEPHDSGFTIDEICSFVAIGSDRLDFTMNCVYNYTHFWKRIIYHETLFRDF